jgi:hypothetical protein
MTRATNPDWFRAEDKAREKAANKEWKAWHDAATRAMRGRGHPPKDTDGLVNAATWLTHLFPGATQTGTLGDVVDALLSCPVPAVRAVVGKAKHKRLRNLLALYAGDILTPEPGALMDAAEWAERECLPALPLEMFADTVLAHVKFLRADRVHPAERDALVLARAVRDCGVADRSGMVGLNSAEGPTTTRMSSSLSLAKYCSHFSYAKPARPNGVEIATNIAASSNVAKPGISAS